MQIPDRISFFFVPMRSSTASRIAAWGMAIIATLTLSALFMRLFGDATQVYARVESHTTIWLWLHLSTIIPSIPLAFYLLGKPKGTTHHRLLGKIWCGLMVATALSALMIRGYFLPNWHGINFIHIFSLMTLVGVPRIIMSARRHDVVAHQQSVLGLCFGGLFIAGLFAFLPGRLMGAWLFGLG
jgi:uncharacterized membrane protein